MENFPYIYNWSNDTVRAMCYGKQCRIVENNAKNNQENCFNHCLVEFEDGGRLWTPLVSLKKIKEKGFSCAKIQKRTTPLA